MTEIVDVDPLDPLQDRLFREWVEVYAAAERALWGDQATPWSAEEIRELQRAPEKVRRALAAVEAGSVVGAVQVIGATRDNLESANCWLSVHPDHQRRGIGSALLAAAEDLARGLGRSVVQDWSVSPEESGGAATAFATRHGYAVAQRSLRSDLTLAHGRDDDAPVDPAYRVETVWDAMPESWLEDRAHLARRMSTDAPMGEIEHEEEDWDAERVRSYYARMTAMGRRFVVSVAREVASGHLVGFTELAVSASTPERAYQQDTLVLREHRGHGLGLAVKAANLRALREGLPGVTVVTTYNAASNEPMLRVNRALGFAVTGYVSEWKKRL
ncbi:GNAT family N-acetyltransferase [Oryzihumus leptocrescens]|uniref:Ribosomal protein S18 acetylase RimI-like enzyme n=1 Tax=Oryzihumus leptocrescens TaxID=297536 RepID=A0A542ZFJ8_9MICO|nr:GNAT family N-acetyltransferase [Oryzihumus leptocrescens]TQL59115.1 ribosomal protein S18 acetylase RimI-like enzyme [Oryzihumus leptocrescens]